jgi:PilZ domain
MEEKRKHARVPTYKTATIFFGRNVRGVACFVMDISEGGAGLHVANMAGVPDTFELLIHGQTVRRPCKVAWKMAKRVGVSYTTDDQPAADKAKLLESKRKHPRRSVSDRGKIIVSRPFSLIDCIVLDISEGGACLEIAVAVQLPPAFELVFAEKRRPCTVAWQVEKRVGVAFK